MRDHSSLRALQGAVARALEDSGHEPEPGLVRARGLAARRRLNVYYHHSRIVQSDALSAIFPAVQRLVGDDFFAQMAAIYGEKYPLQCGDLRTFGSRLPEFIEGFEPVTPLPYLADVARLEWACHESLHSGEAAPLNATASLAHLRLASHVRLLHSPFPVARIWEFALTDQDPETPRLSIEGVGPDHLLIMRPDLDVEVYALSADDWAWLSRQAGNHEGQAPLPTPEETKRRHAWLHKKVLTYFGTDRST